jgi:hypothetical protein
MTDFTARMQSSLQLFTVFVMSLDMSGRMFTIREEMKTSHDEILAMLKKDGTRRAAPQSDP